MEKKNNNYCPTKALAGYVIGLGMMGIIALILNFKNIQMNVKAYFEPIYKDEPLISHALDHYLMDDMAMSINMIKNSEETGNVSAYFAADGFTVLGHIGEYYSITAGDKDRYWIERNRIDESISFSLLKEMDGITEWTVTDNNGKSICYLYETQIKQQEFIDLYNLNWFFESRYPFSQDLGVLTVALDRTGYFEYLLFESEDERIEVQFSY